MPQLDGEEVMRQLLEELRVGLIELNSARSLSVTIASVALLPVSMGRSAIASRFYSSSPPAFVSTAVGIVQAQLPVVDVIGTIFPTIIMVRAGFGQAHTAIATTMDATPLTANATQRTFPFRGFTLSYSSVMTRPRESMENRTHNAPPDSHTSFSASSRGMAERL